MQPSTLETLTVNALGGRTPTVVAKAAKTAMRVLIKNVGAALVFIATAPDDVNPQSGPTTGTFRLPPGDEDVFVLAPNGSLYALAIGAGARLSVARSEAMPFDLKS